MIGERLEEARKRKGVTIREAAEATKIRGDYLLAMEDNGFDIPLPQIYVRGFLKNYARYLKLDPSRVLTDYDAHLLGRAPHSTTPARTSSSTSSRESLGRVELPDEEDSDDGSPDAPSSPVVVTEAPEEDEGPEPELRFNLDRRHDRPTPGARETPEEEDESWNENKALYMKIGLVFAGILVISIILVILVQLLTGGDDSPEINPEIATQQSQEARPAQQAQVTTSPAQEDTIIITASDNVTLIVEQTQDNKRLFSGSLNAGEIISLDKQGPVSIRFTNGSAISIEKNGQQFRPGQSGVGRTMVE